MTYTLSIMVVIPLSPISNGNRSSLRHVADIAPFVSADDQSADRVVTLCSYLLIAEVVVGTIGNSMICTAVYRRKSLRTAVNALVVNVSVAGLLAALLCAPLIYVANYRWDNKIICLLPNAVWATVSSVQLLTLVFISAERLHAIARPFDRSSKGRRVGCCVIVSWVVGVACGTGSALGFGDSPTHYRCHYSWPPEGEKGGPEMRYRYGIYVLVPGILVSVLIIFVCYGGIAVLLYRHGRRLHSTPAHEVLSPSGEVTSTYNLHASSPAYALRTRAATPAKTYSHAHLNYGGGVVCRLCSTLNRGKLKRTASISPRADNGSPAFPKSAVRTTIARDSSPEANQRVTANGAVECTCKREATPTRNASDIFSGEEERPRSSLVKNPVHTINIYDEHGLAAKAQNNLPRLVVGDICVMGASGSKFTGRRRFEVKTARVTFVVVLSFLASWCPLTGATFAVQLTDTPRRKLHDLYAISLCLAVLATSLNPVTYGLATKQFRREFVSSMRRLARYLMCSGEKREKING